jgi:serine/threonine-protein kinase
MAVAFDLNRQEVKGQPVPVVGNLMQALNVISGNHNTGAGQYNVSGSGWLAYVPGGIRPDDEHSLVRVDYEGSAHSVVDFKAAFSSPRFSPDGKRIAYSTSASQRQVWIFDTTRGTATRFTGDGWAGSPIWMPNGKQIVFAWSKSGQQSLWRQPSDGSSPMERIAASDGWQIPGSFTPDGLTLAFVEFNPKTSYDILLLDESRRVKPFLNSQAAETHPEISPDGRWLAYVSDETGSDEVWVRPFPGPGGKWQISNAGGREPIWSRDGRQLYFRQWAPGQIWVADVRTENGFSAAKPRLVVEQQGLHVGTPVRGWDLAPDGRSFLMVQMGARKPESASEMILVQNWFEELKRLCPTGMN